MKMMDEENSIIIDGDEENENGKLDLDQNYLYSNEKTLISQGAEARLYKCFYLGRPAVLKERFSKKYRHPELDKSLTKSRIRNESRAILKCKQLGIDVPTIYFFNTETNAIIFEFIDGVTAKDFIEQARSSSDSEIFEDQMKSLGHNIGLAIGKLHFSGLCHGDLTTSNIILRSSNPEHVCLIDFGLSSSKTTVEDFGVDLYVLERAIRTTHTDLDYLMDEILNGYQSIEWKNAKASVKKLDEVRMRGRKREMIG